MQKLDITKYPDQEVRTSRDVFTAKLRKICAKLDAGSEQVVTCKDQLNGADVVVAAKAKSLWVFGSYARGALTCGDLDLILQLEYAGALPRRPALNKAFVGVHPQVRVYHGTPGENDTYLKLSDAILIWEPGMDWAAALASIETNPNAGRFARAGDVLPFRSEQDGLNLEQREMLAEMHEKGIFNWRFIPLSTVPQVLTPSEVQTSEPREAWVLQCYGDRSAMRKTLLPVVLGFARQLAEQYCPGAKVQCGSGEEIRVGGIQLQVGSLNLQTETLSSYDTTAVAFIPALSTRGPNGFWLIERGPNHPLVKALAGAQAWVHVDAQGELCLVNSVTFAEAGLEREAVLLEVFSSQQEAQEWANQLYEDDDHPDRDAFRSYPMLIEGQELLQAISGADVVQPYSDAHIPLTRRGERFCEGDEAVSRPKAAQLATKLRALLSSESLVT